MKSLHSQNQDIDKIISEDEYREINAIVGVASHGSSTIDRNSHNMRSRIVVLPPQVPTRLNEPNTVTANTLEHSKDAIKMSLAL